MLCTIKFLDPVDFGRIREMFGYYVVVPFIFNQQGDVLEVKIPEQAMSSILFEVLIDYKHSIQKGE